MLRILTLFLVLTSFFSPAWAQNADGLPQGDFSALRKTGVARVHTVIDPQTVQLDNGRLVHLTGLNFPDLSISADEPGALSTLALRVLRDMLHGQSVFIYQTEDSKLGRVTRMEHEIAHLVRQSDLAWVQGSLITLGLARVRTNARNPEMAAQMYALEDTARAQKLGLWAEEAYAVLAPDALLPAQLHRFVVAEGTIRGVASKNSRIYLNFGDNWRDDFTVSIEPGGKRAFSKQGLNPLGWGGQRVQVRGWLDSYNGPMIEIDHPEAIRLLSNP